MPSARRPTLRSRSFADAAIHFQLIVLTVRCVRMSATAETSLDGSEDRL
jgi:hypothetical protein